MKKYNEASELFEKTEAILEADRFMTVDGSVVEFTSKEVKTLKEAFSIADEIIFGNDGMKWLDIFVRWQRSPIHSKTVDGLQGFLEDNFCAPIDKKV